MWVKVMKNIKEISFDKIYIGMPVYFRGSGGGTIIDKFSLYSDDWLKINFPNISNRFWCICAIHANFTDIYLDQTRM